MIKSPMQSVDRYPSSIGRRVPFVAASARELVTEREGTGMRVGSDSGPSVWMDQTATIAAAAFCLLCQPSRPSAARPVAKSGRVGGTGVAATIGPSEEIVKSPKLRD
jgi:hypothetical protein